MGAVVWSESNRMPCNAASEQMLTCRKVVLRSLWTHLQVCWDIKLTSRYMWLAHALGWGLPALFFAISLLVTGVSYQLDGTCMPNPHGVSYKATIPILKVFLTEVAGFRNLVRLDDRFRLPRGHNPVHHHRLLLHCVRSQPFPSPELATDDRHEHNAFNTEHTFGQRIHAFRQSSKALRLAPSSQCHALPMAKHRSQRSSHHAGNILRDGVCCADEKRERRCEAQT